VGVANVERELGEAGRAIDVHAVALGRLDGEREPQALRAGRRRVRHASREERLVHVPVVGEEEGAGDLAAQAGEAGAHVGGAEYVGAHPQLARHLGTVRGQSLGADPSPRVAPMLTKF
jgi:hypothetical protein